MESQKILFCQKRFRMHYFSNYLLSNTVLVQNLTFNEIVIKLSDRTPTLLLNIYEVRY